MLEDRTQPNDIFTRLNLTGFELAGALSSPEYYRNRILLDEASSLVYQNDRYIAAPHDQRIKVDHQRMITLVHWKNDDFSPMIPSEINHTKNDSCYLYVARSSREYFRKCN
jgi:hypothetical protein